MKEIVERIQFESMPSEWAELDLELAREFWLIVSDETDRSIDPWLK